MHKNDSHSYEVERGNAVGGVTEMKNFGFAIGQI